MLYPRKELFKFGFKVYLKALPLAEFHFKFEGPYRSGKIPKLKLKYLTLCKGFLKFEKFFTYGKEQL
jgi:hypothetical protein